MPVRVQALDSKGWKLLGNAFLHDWRQFWEETPADTRKTSGNPVETKGFALRGDCRCPQGSAGLPWGERSLGHVALCPPCCSEHSQLSSNGFLDVLAASYPFRGLLFSSVLLCLTHSCLIMKTNTMVWMHGRLLCWGHQPPGGIRSLSGDGPQSLAHCQIHVCF